MNNKRGAGETNRSAKCCFFRSTQGNYSRNLVPLCDVAGMHPAPILSLGSHPRVRSPLKESIRVGAVNILLFNQSLRNPLILQKNASTVIRRHVPLCQEKPVADFIYFKITSFLPLVTSLQTRNCRALGDLRTGIDSVLFLLGAINRIERAIQMETHQWLYCGRSRKANPLRNWMELLETLAYAASSDRDHPLYRTCLLPVFFVFNFKRHPERDETQIRRICGSPALSGKLLNLTCLKFGSILPCGADFLLFLVSEFTKEHAQLITGESKNARSSNEHTAYISNGLASKQSYKNYPSFYLLCSAQN